MSTFERAFAVILGHEGGYDCNRLDPGNWTGGIVGVGDLRGTKLGISAAAYPQLAIADLTREQAAAIYRRDYWDPVAGDDLPPPLALLVFDAAVNNGVGAAIRWLEAAVGAPVDRNGPAVGPQTKAALATRLATDGLPAICSEFLARRVFFMGALSSWSTFGLGWARRLCALPYQSMSMEA